MANWIKSLFRSGEPSSEGPGQDRSVSEDVPSEAGVTPEYERLLGDLVEWVCANSSHPLRREEVDTTVHIYDAGYVDSLKGADLLVHIEKRYAVFIAETEFAGRLSRLDSLARHIVEAGQRKPE